MKVNNILKSGTRTDTLKGHKLNKETTERITKIIMEVNKREKKSC